MKVLSQIVRDGLEVTGWIDAAEEPSAIVGETQPEILSMEDWADADSPYFRKDGIYFTRGGMQGRPYYYTPTPVKETAARYYGIVRCQWCGCNIPETLAVCSRCAGPQGMRI